MHLPHFCLQRLSHVDQEPPQKSDFPRQMLRQFRQDLDRQRPACMLYLCLYTLYIVHTLPSLLSIMWIQYALYVVWHVI